LSGTNRARGKQVKVADGLIVVTALHHKLVVVTRNVHDFAELGVDVLNPWSGS
jgi:predicted nucleic acid-binding protein